ncbi:MULTISPECIES: winged helix-turn-helix domain-containing protein [unclassified Pseudoalteromonas]|uniref:winged helix-turn-helix domain-containing protein n=1 Tax=unclassified Pseudoalteromonas TaxID=194690 RepID=UPI0018CD3A67|nr:MULTISPECIES: winged helix-turn-helix domain-containing protein [unclassified Pseudoalteromonas]MBG9992200.1 winged helix-turn-helix domain-containing protein [Pseudoalteromonas sp. NZS37]MBH0045866.1 winged helix-turn-helix domain-containing protein [Pseudoalteromonas sp. NZS11_1]
MKHLLIFISLILFSSQANAFCLDASNYIEGVKYGVCGEQTDSISLTPYFIIWMLLNVLFGQMLNKPNIHVGFKYLLFLCAFPLSPLVLLMNLTGMVVFRVYQKYATTSSAKTAQPNPDDAKAVIEKPSINQLIIGEYTFDSMQQSLIKEDNLYTLEPKCMQVLSYLIEQQPRIVSLEELHNNVWENQIVTDTAVRRVISKLRVALNDNDTKNPTYIKSVMKRGYQLIAKVKTQPIE